MDILEHEVRPWGEFTVLREGEGFKVKSLIVRAGQRLSMQYHEERDEYWTVVRGTARVLLGDRGREQDVFETDLRVGGQLIISKGRIHRLSNLSTDPSDDLEVIEVQIGRCREDDIVRLADDHGRAVESGGNG